LFTLGTGMVRIFVNKIGRHLHQNTGNYDRQEPEQAEFPTAESETGTHETGTTAALMLKGRIAQNQALIFDTNLLS